MSGIALKIGSLAIRTFSKPIANAIKRQAREHEGFRRRCVQGAQALHRIDMQLRLGLLRQSAIVEKESAKEVAEAAAKRRKHQTTTVNTEAQAKVEEDATVAVKDEEKPKAQEKPKPAPKPKIRPLSEARAIDMGANFISEAFLFMVASGLIIFESMRAKRKENNRREDVAEKLAQLEESEQAARRGLLELEKELIKLREKEVKTKSKHPERILSKDLWEENNEVEDEVEPVPWYNRIASIIQGKVASDGNTKLIKGAESPGAVGTSEVSANITDEKQVTSQAEQARPVATPRAIESSPTPTVPKT